MLNFKRLFFFLLIVCLLLFLSFSVSAQTDEERMKELQQQIQQLEEEAQKYRTNIAEDQTKAATLNREINLLKNQISQLETQIALTGKKIDRTKIEITGLENKIYDTQQKINYQKSSIANLLLFLSKRDDESLAEIMIKNQNLSDFLRQEHYARSVSSELLGLVGDLKENKETLENNKTALEGQKQNLEGLRGEQSAQKISLGQVKNNKNTLLVQTKGEEARYQKMLKDVEARQTLFFKELRELETKVIQGGLYLVHVTAENLPKSGTDLFKWPEDYIRVTQGYGMTSYAKRGAYGGAPHNGIDISAGYGTPIKAIGDGEIIANGQNDGWGNWVAIKHSPYNLVSVYGHMSSLSFLRVGTQVKQGQVIGYEGSTGNSTGSHLHLSIYKDFFTYIKDKNGQLYFNYFEGSINPNNYLR